MEAEPPRPAGVMTEAEMRRFAQQSRHGSEPLKVSKCRFCNEHTFSSDRRLTPASCGRLACGAKAGEKWAAGC
jgi:hypothetical protein